MPSLYQCSFRRATAPMSISDASASVLSRVLDAGAVYRSPPVACSVWGVPASFLQAVGAHTRAHLTGPTTEHNILSAYTWLPWRLPFLATDVHRVLSIAAPVG